VLAATLEGADVATLRGVMDKMKDKLKTAAIVLASVSDGKVSLIAGVTAMPAAARLLLLLWAVLVAGAAELVLAVVSLGLPHTPPKPATAGSSLAWLEAAKFLRYPFILVLFIVTFIDAMVHQCYFIWT